MSISYPLDFPALSSGAGPRTTGWHASSNAGYAENEFTNAAQIQAYSGDRWAIDLTFPPLEKADSEILKCFILSLRGRVGTFRLGDGNSQQPRGPAGGSPQTSGSSNPRGAQTVNTKGWAHSITGILLIGDFIQIGERLHKCLSNVNSDGSGNATIDIFPRLRESPPDGTTIITTGCTGLFMLLSGDNLIWTDSDKKIAQISLSCIEAL